MFDLFITWQDVCCICTVVELCNKMDIDAATGAIKKEQYQWKRLMIHMALRSLV